MAIIDLSEVIPKFAPGGSAYSRPVRFGARLKAGERVIKRGRTVNRNVTGRPLWREHEQISNSAQALVDRVRNTGWDAEVEEAMQNYNVVDETGVSIRDLILESMSKDEVSMLKKARKEYLKNQQAPTAANGVPTGRERKLQDELNASNKQLNELRTSAEADKVTNARRISEYEEKISQTNEAVENLKAELAEKVKLGKISKEEATQALAKLDAANKQIAELQAKVNDLTNATNGNSGNGTVPPNNTGKNGEATTGQLDTGTTERRNPEDTNKKKWYKKDWYKNPWAIAGLTTAAGIGGYWLNSDDDVEAPPSNDDDERVNQLESLVQTLIGELADSNKRIDQLTSTIASGVPREMPVGNDRTDIEAALKTRDQEIADLKKALLTLTTILEDLRSKLNQTPEPVVISPTDETLDALRREYYEQSMKHRPLKRRRLRKTINTILSEHGLHDDWID